jgi:hypothetical protein
MLTNSYISKKLFKAVNNKLYIAGDNQYITIIDLITFTEENILDLGTDYFVSSCVFKEDTNTLYILLNTKEIIKLDVTTNTLGTKVQYSKTEYINFLY